MIGILFWKHKPPLVALITVIGIIESKKFLDPLWSRDWDLFFLGKNRLRNWRNHCNWRNWVEKFLRDPLWSCDWDLFFREKIVSVIGVITWFRLYPPRNSHHNWRSHCNWRDWVEKIPYTHCDHVIEIFIWEEITKLNHVITKGIFLTQLRQLQWLRQLRRRFFQKTISITWSQSSITWSQRH